MVIKKTKVLFFIICILQLFYLLQFRSGFEFEIIKDPFNKNAGISSALSSEIIESRNILNKHEINNFNLSKKLKKDTYFYQRSIEFNYPRRIDQSSKFILFSINEDIKKDCKIIETSIHLKLIHC